MTPLIPGSPGFVERLLADRIGLDVASVGEGLIARGVEVRMVQLGIRRLEDYERILLGTTGEIQALIEEVVIPESWFFRDDRPFATFRSFVDDGWVSQPGRGTLSVLCLPCASGEEPYSIVIALLELGLPRERFEVVAVDISERAIRRAAAGLYGANAFRGMDAGLQAKYFTPSRGRFLLKAAVRSAVRFEPGNILDPGLLADHAGFDVVFCRNLLIYFDAAARVRAFANLDRLTADAGLLFLGHADRPDPDASSRFAPFADKGSFVFRKQGRPLLEAPKPPASPARPFVQGRPVATVGARLGRPSAPTPHQPPPSPPPSSPAPARPAPARSAAVDREGVLAGASALADQGKYAEALRLIGDRMGRGSLDAGTHFLLGIIHQAAGDRPAAEAELSKAIYLDPEHDEALLALALLARRKGDMSAEALYRRRADRVLARKGQR